MQLILLIFYFLFWVHISNLPEYYVLIFSSFSFGFLPLLAPIPSHPAHWMGCIFSLSWSRCSPCIRRKGLAVLLSDLRHYYFFPILSIQLSGSIWVLNPSWIGFLAGRFVCSILFWDLAFIWISQIIFSFSKEKFYYMQTICIWLAKMRR